MRRRSRWIVASAMLAAAVTLVSCSSSSSNKNKGSDANNETTAAGGHQTAEASFNAAFDKIVNPSNKTGGTLKLLIASDCDSWDPGRTYYGYCWNFQRMFTRSLIGYEVVNGTEFKLAPDLATDMGQHNDDFTQWTYTLKDGLKFSNGQPITAADVKWGLERLFAPEISGGPNAYFIAEIKHPDGYKGPYQGGELDSIIAEGQKITINLSTPDADFNYLMSMAASAPVPAKVEGGPGYSGASYGKMPVSSGPFMIKSYTPNNQIVFTRNPNWSQKTDTIRKPLVNEIDITVNTNETDIDNQVEAGQADARADSKSVQASFQSKLLTDPALKKYADNPVAASTRYATVIPDVIPNVHCRLAVFYAWDKAATLRAYGGPSAGQIAGAMTPPGIAGYDPSLNPYPSGPDNTGDVAKAKEELKLCGKPGGFSTKFAYNTPSNQSANVFKAEQQALARVGIKVTGVPHSSKDYYSSFIGNPANLKNQGIGIAVAGWGADFPTGVGFYQTIANGNARYPNGTSNYPSLNDPVINDVLNKAPGGKATDADWTTVNEQIMKDAVYIPWFFQKTLYYHTPRLTNVTCNNALAFGEYDWVNIGVGG